MLSSVAADGHVLKYVNTRLETLSFPPHIVRCDGQISNGFLFTRVQNLRVINLITLLVKSLRDEWTEYFTVPVHVHSPPLHFSVQIIYCVFPCLTLICFPISKHYILSRYKGNNSETGLDYLRPDHRMTYENRTISLCG